MTALRSTSAALLAALLVSGVLAPAEALVKTPAEYAGPAFAAINENRAERDLRLLRRSDCLKEFANQQARRMARKKRAWHQDLQLVQKDCGMEYVGEAIVAGFKTGRGAVNRGMMKTAAHRAIIMDRKSRRLAVGARRAKGGGWFVCVLVGHK